MLSITQIFGGNFKHLKKKESCIFCNFFQIMFKSLENDFVDLKLEELKLKILYYLLIKEEQKIYLKLYKKYDDRALDFYKLYTKHWNAINVLRKIYLKEYYFEELFELKNDIKLYLLLMSNNLINNKLEIERLSFFNRLEKLIIKIDMQEAIMKNRNKEFGLYDEDGNDRDQMELDLADPLVWIIVDSMMDRIHPCHTLSEENLEYIVDMDPTNYLEIPLSKLFEVIMIKVKRKVKERGSKNKKK